MLYCRIYRTCFFVLSVLIYCGCSSDAVQEPPIVLPPGCDDPAAYVFVEKDSLLLLAFDQGSFAVDSDWKSYKGGRVWTGSENMQSPGDEVVQFQMQIQHPGTYRLLWRSAVTKGSDGTEHNDSWVRFPDASDYFGASNDKKVYPKGTGKSPNPNGTSVDGWFKVYRSGNDLDFKWHAATSDHEGLGVYVKFNEPGNYTMEVSGRSSGHAIDRIVLYQEMRYSQQQATDVEILSDVQCDY